MEYSYFLEALMRHKKIMEDLHELNQIGIDFYEGKYKLAEQVGYLFECSISSHYTEEGLDWVNWFIYESDYGQKDWSKFPSFDSNGKLLYEAGEPRPGATDENGEPICYSYESLWEYIEKNHRLQ